MCIHGRGKIGYLTGKTKAPAETTSTFAPWDAENSMVMAWLVNFMEEDISAYHMWYPLPKNFRLISVRCILILATSHKLWVAVSSWRDLEGGDSVRRYFNILKGLWQVWICSSMTLNGKC
ncbi:hypothetical protein F511_17904 [Dorcoceras hygrometricum]|uniref:Uncharacterized protein n=1 Tax=Dorcoceras hygrometricum TaxID=472368 RepID=A0A2Z7ASX1_9LAMI|nr:hypothetical protein F511_17904 [Dorcoceras hygrometricum]